VTSAHSQHVLDIKGNSSDPGTHVLVWENHGNANQKWRFTKKGFIESKLKKDLVLDFQEVDNKKVLIVNNKKESNNESQKWRLEGNGLIVNRANGHAIDIEGASKEKGADVILWEKHGNANQLWNVELPKKKERKVSIKVPGIGFGLNKVILLVTLPLIV
jgi:hypothetical protein